MQKLIMRKKIVAIVKEKKGLMDFMTEVLMKEEGEEAIVYKIFDEGNIVITHTRIKNNGKYFQSVDKFTFTPKTNNKGANND